MAPIAASPGVPSRAPGRRCGNRAIWSRCAGSDGWPTDTAIETLRTRFLDSTDPAEQRRLAAELQTQAFASVPFVPLGQLRQPTAYRRNVQGILSAPVPFLWGVSKT